ncbi:septal ring lytic transglycosylase RlpA family protein [Hydrogenophaga sp.]|uniref:septal ring lytic transglycosylase RlpA family protein n=1 Tax=Hydrogenophaga sp. TaxID=1904254 RepID=UPI0027242557|nr:septal ring lytic transglycosylase RlpA family protein [Hydrogenophaga sp.]MDO8904368.1 septal ring lytic transglycosylase RlpA family protein [Hydrogenophaga sp.]
MIRPIRNRLYAPALGGGSAPGPAPARLRAGSTLALSLVLWLGGCAAPSHIDSAPSGASQIGSETGLEIGIEVGAGIASWYGERFHGRRTASGEAFNMHEFTAAHRTLPFGTWVRVRNLDNGREVVVRINDRGPFTRGRVIDLSRAAADTIGIVQAGTSRVALFQDGVVPVASSAQ